ncbi:Endosulfine-domain-containing protein [Ascobolus immersus RN42]|uniref:mRNA stability protein n=1 Tax=Ascobolus immersus RN42 TaxID=1160509 RepID=A0A3N4I5N6_ASCIM|nr:Endosulfine-domain-containing protein [Ascobolus immersus RN42]
MLPAQKNKVDISQLSEEEQKLFRLYGKLPSKRDILSNKLKERKYFDSGDYALSKAGKASDVGVTNIGSQHPQPENIPHVHSPVPGAIKVGSPSSSTSITGGQGSPVKDTNFNVVSPPKSPLQTDSNEAKLETEAGAESDSPKDDAEKSTPKPVPSRWQATTAEE